MDEPQAKRILNKIERAIERPKELQVGDDVWVKGKITGCAGDIPVVDIDGRNYSFVRELLAERQAKGEQR